MQQVRTLNLLSRITERPQIAATQSMATLIAAAPGAAQCTLLGATGRCRASTKQASVKALVRRMAPKST
jgi:hypothetical protein